MDVEYKEVGPERLSEIVALNTVIFEGMFDREPYNIGKYNEKLKDANYKIFIAEEDGKIIGDSISFEKDGSWYLWIFGVSKMYRGQGVARKLFELNESYAITHGYKKITAKTYNVSKDMLRMMIRRGYNIVDIHKNKNNKNEYNKILFEYTLQ